MVVSSNPSNSKIFLYSAFLISYNSMFRNVLYKIKSINLKFIIKDGVMTIGLRLKLRLIAV